MRDVLWRDGLPIVRKITGMPEKAARTLLGRLLKSTHDDCARVYRALREAENLGAADPVAWLNAACNDTRVKNRITDSLAGIYGIDVPTDELPTINLFSNEWTTAP
jgi:hypothetical protein